MRQKLLFLLLSVGALCPKTLGQCDGHLHVGTYYVDNSCATNGNGSSTTCGSNGPFNSLTNMQSKDGGYSAGNFICLKRGQTYRESFTLPSSGATGNHITLDAWGTGDKPIMKASNIFSSWSRTSGTTYQVPASTQPDYLWKDGVYQTKGTSITGLSNHNWYWASGLLYYREDEDDLSNHLMEATVRDRAIYSASSPIRSYWTINKIRFMQANYSGGYGIWLNGGTEFTINDCEFIESRAVRAVSTTSILINGANVNGSHGNYFGQFWLDGTSSGTINNTTIRNGDPGESSINVSGSATLNIYNALFDQTGGSAIQSSSSGNTNVMNSIFTGSESGWVLETVKNTGPGILYIDYSVILPSGRNGSAFLTNVREGNHNIYSSPMFSHAAMKGYLVLAYDDTPHFKEFEELSRIADQYGYSVGLAVNVNNLFSSQYQGAMTSLQDAINRGHWITNHSYTHADLGSLTGMTVQYVGAGSVATMTINHSRLSTNVTGAPDNLNLDLTLPAYNSVVLLCSYLQSSTSGKYKCSGGNPNNYYTAATNLADVGNQDIKTAPYSAILDEERYDTYEIDGAHSMLTSLFKTSAGGSYPLDTFVFPYGGVSPTRAVSHLLALHYLGARTTITWLTNNWTMSAGLDLFSLPADSVATSLGEIAYLWNSASCNDFSGNGKNFTCNNITYSSTVHPEIQTSSYVSAIFDGSSSYASRSDSVIDFHRGDGFWSAFVSTNVSNKKQTLFFQGTDDNNFHTLYVSATGSVVYSVVSSGSETIHVETASGLIPTSTWQRITLVFNRNTYKLYVGNAQQASLYSLNRPGTYTGSFYIGTSYSFITVKVRDPFSGYMSFMSFGRDNFSSATSFINTIGAYGGIVYFYAHGDPGMPTPLFRIIFDALKSSSTNVMVGSFHDVLTDLRANGSLASDNRTLTWAQNDQSDYHFLPNSPAINAGTTIGAPAVDSAGNVRIGNVDIGTLEFLYRLRRSRSYWW